MSESSGIGADYSLTENGSGGEVSWSFYRKNGSVSDGYSVYDPSRWANGDPRPTSAAGDGCQVSAYLESSTEGGAYSESFWGQYLTDAEYQFCTVFGDEHIPEDCFNWGQNECGLWDGSLTTITENDINTCEFTGDRTTSSGAKTEVYGETTVTWTVKCVGFEGVSRNSEYTTDRLKGEVKGYATARLPSEFPEDPPVMGQTPSASSEVSADESCAYFGKSKWRAWISGTVKDERYKIEYYKVIRRNGSTVPEISGPLGEEVTASGESWWYTPSDSDLTPEWESPSCSPERAGTYIVSLEGFSMHWVGSGDDEPGDGGPPSSPGGCGGKCPTSSTATFPGYPEYDISMGSANDGSSAGEFTFFASTPSTTMAQPDSLGFSRSHEPTVGVEVLLDDEDRLRQVVSAQAIRKGGVLSHSL